MKMYEGGAPRSDRVKRIFRNFEYTESHNSKKLPVLE